MNYLSGNFDKKSEWTLQFDTIKLSEQKKRSFGTLKINPFQPIFSEIPVSFEIYRTPRRSLQFQFGIIFPRRNILINQILFNSMGEEGMATNDGPFSYRNSPFYNDAGLNLKMETSIYLH